MAPYLRYSCGGAGFVYLPPNGCRVLGDYRAGFALYVVQSLVQRVNDRYISSAAGILVGFFFDHLMIFTGHYGAADLDPAVFQIYVLPIQRCYLGAAQRGDGKECGNLHRSSFDVLDEGVQFGFVQEFHVLFDDLRQLGGEMLAGGPGEHLGEEAPAVGDRLGGVGSAFPVDGFSDLGFGNVLTLSFHEGGESAFLASLIPTYRGRGDAVFVVCQPEVDGLGQGLVAQGLLFDLDDALLERHGLCDGFFFCGLCDGNALPVYAQLDKPVA